MTVFKPKNSPFDQIPRTISALRWLGGFPLEEDSADSSGGFTVVASSYLKLAIMVALANISPAVIVITCQYYIGWQPFIENETLTKMDLASGLMAPLLGFLLTVSLFFLLLSKRLEIHGMLQMFAKVSHRFDVEEVGRKSIGQARKWLLIEVPLIVCTCGVFVAFAIEILKIGDPPLNLAHPVLYWTYVATNPLTVIFANVNPVVATVDLMILYLLFYIQGHFCQWRSKMERPGTDQHRSTSMPMINVIVPEERQEKKKSLELLDYDKHVALGIELCQIVQTVNDVLAPFLFCQLTYCFVEGTFSVYCFSSLFFDLTNVGRMTFASCYGLYSVYVLLKMFYFCAAGQRLEDEMQLAKAAFEMHSGRASSYSRADEDGRFMAGVLLSRLGTARVVSPMSYFSVNHNAFFGAFASMFTYLIVLLQFRVDERKQGT